MKILLSLLIFYPDLNYASTNTQTFSLFSLQYGANNKVHQKTQQVLWYVESWFRQALIKIIKANDWCWTWMQIYISTGRAGVFGVILSKCLTNSIVKKLILVFIGCATVEKQSVQPRRQYFSHLNKARKRGKREKIETHNSI